ncbi:hypothetical protein ACFQ2B_04500 [Streptomyces stramineus]
MLGALGDALRKVTLNPPRIPFVTNVTGTWITDEQATSPEHWIAHTRNTVRFSDGIAALWERGNPLLVEIGPGDVLTKLTRARLEGSRSRPWRACGTPRPSAPTGRSSRRPSAGCGPPVCPST